MRRNKALAATALAAGLGSVLLFGTAQAEPTAASGFSVTTFATAPAGSSAPDSIAVVGGDVYVGYGNGGDPTGAGAVSTIAEYNSSGTLLNSTMVAGHNDGLRYNPATGVLWAVQNEDANANVVLVTPSTLAKSAPYNFSSSPPHGGGYDDVAFRGGTAFVSASNPASNPNTAPAIAIATLSPGTVTTSGVLNGNATVHVINTGGTTTLNLQDPDSMNFAPNGRLVLDSQADGQLVFVANPGAANQSASVLNLSNQVDDTVFAAGGQQTLLVAAKGQSTVFEITGDFAAGTAYSAAASNATVPNPDFVGLLNQSTGALTPIVSGLSGPGGEAFLTTSSVVPEPASLTLLGAGFLGLIGLGRRRGG